MILLNIGCGPSKMEGVINLDNNPDFEPEVVHDLEVTPLPFEDESIHGVIASHIFEHIRNYPELLKDIYRVLVPGGVLNINVPYFTSRDAWGDPTHVRAFSELSFLPDFWKGWKVSEVSMIDGKKTYTHHPVVHIQAQLIKEGAEDGSET